MTFLQSESFDAIEGCLKMARQSTCQRSKCGAIIVKDGEIIGRGFNSPPANLEGQRRCSCSKEALHHKVTDKTCCIHAEQRAIMDALTKNPKKINKARLYFMRINDDGEIEPAGEPYCTICSKLALDIGISEFVLYRKDGWCIYSTEQYNKLSYLYNG